jgi:hypothetical protein
MPAINVARTDTFEQQRVKINDIGSQLFNVTSGGSDLSTGNLRLGDGLVTSPSLAFVSDDSLGIYKNGNGVLGFASASKKIADLSSTSTKYYRDFIIEKNSLDGLFISIINSGENYDGGDYTDVPAIGGTGDSALLGFTVDGFTGSITNTGTGYTPAAYLNIPVIGGSGTGATIDFTVPQISGSVTNGGINYYPGTYNGVALLGGTGSNMTADIEVSAFAATVTSGSNYPDGLFKSIELTGGSGTGIKVNLQVQNGGVQPFGGVDSSQFVSVTSQYQVGDVLTGSIVTTGTQTFIVKSSLGNKYFLDGFEGGDFSILKGKTYVWNINDSTSDQHPFYISSTQDDTNSILGSADGVTYELDGSTVTPTDFLANFTAANTRTVIYAVPTNPANATVYYNCSVHPSMGGALTHADPNVQQGGFQLVVDTLGGVVETVTIADSGDGLYTLGDVLTVDPLELYDQNNLQAAVEGSGFQLTLGGNFGAIEELDQISDFGTGYQVGDVLTLPTAVNNVTTYARGELDFFGLSFSSNAGATALSWSGSATGATRTITNVVPTNSGNTSGIGLTITVDVLLAEGNSSYDNVTITANGSGYLPGDTLYVPGSQLGGVDGAPGGGGGGNDLLISITNIEPGDPQINIGDTTGVSVGDAVDLIQNINNPGQIPGGTVVQSVDSATTITMSEAPTTPGAVDLKITNQNLTYLTVPDTSSIATGFLVAYQSGNGQIIDGTTVTGIIDATTVEISIQPTTAGAMVVNFEPEYGGGNGFAYTIDKLGVIQEVSVIDGGNGYSVGDILGVNPFDLVQPEVYAVTNLQVDNITFVSNVIPDTTFSVGDQVRDAGGAILASQVDVSTTVAAAADGVYSGVAQIATSGNGVGATFDIQRDNTGAVLSVVITTGSEGSFYANGDTITLPGAAVGGSTPADNIVVSVSSITDPGDPVTVRKVKSSGGTIDYIIIDTFGFNDGGVLVKDNAPAVGYDIDTVTLEYRYYIDLDDGNGAQLTPSWTMYAGNSYQFDLSDGSNGSHVFALSQFRDGMWGPSRFEGVVTTLSTVSPVITVNTTTGILPGMVVVKEEGDGILADGTTVVSVDSPTQLTLSSAGTTAGDITVTIMGAEYTTGVTREGDTLTIKVSESTPTLYYYCATDNVDHINEGGEDNEEAVLTIDPVNTKTFGSGFQLLVTDVAREEIVKGEVLTGEFTCTLLTTQDINSPEATINALTGSTVESGTSVTTPLLQPSSGNLDIAVKVPTVDSVNITALNLNFGAVAFIDCQVGDFTTAGYVSAPEVRIGSNLKIEDVTSSITSFNTQDINFIPDLGRIVNIDTVTALAVPVGNTNERPPAGIVLDGCIRFNTETNQYEGYSSATQAWSSLGGVRDLDGNTYILAEETIGANDNTLWFINDDVNTIKVSPQHLEFVNMKKIRSVNVTAPDYVNWNANTPVLVGEYLKYKNNLYEVTVAGTTATTGNEPTHTSGSVINGSAELTYWGLAVAPLTFEDIEELRVGPTGGLPLVINGDLRLLQNKVTTDVNDLILQPNAGKKVTISAETTLTLPVGTDAQRGTAEQGGIRFNTSSLQFEGYDGANWGSLGGVKDVDQNTYIIPELSPGSNENVLYFFNDNNNTLQLTTTALDFFEVDTIRSVTSAEFEITANLMTFNQAETTLDNTAADRTFLHTSKQYFDLGLSSGVSVDPVLRLDDQGDVYLNTTFGTGTFTGVKVFDGELKEFELADVKILTEKITLVKGTSNNGNSILYNTTVEKGAKTTVVAENPSTGEREFIEFGVIDNGVDVYHSEYGNLRTGNQLVIPTFEITPQNEVRINIELGADVAPTESVIITFVSNITKR